MGLRLLCVVAHPDDECFAFGGALLLASDRGVQTSVVCLTDGQAATHRGESKSPEDLGRMRREEFVASCKILGVTHEEIWDYQDAQLEFAEFSRLAGRIVATVRTFQPHVVITFGGEGALNSHPDHAMVSAATTAAFHWAGNPKRYEEAGEVWQPQRLFYLSGDFFLPDRREVLLSPWTLTLDVSQVLERKKEAFAAHTSQAPLMERTRALFEEHGQHERYLLAAAVKPHAARQSLDMFEGVRE